MKIKKASGLIEDFDPRKLIESLMRAGAEREQAEDILERVLPDISPFTSTRKIYRLAHKYLKDFNRSTVLRYSLKNALMRLGPSGYPFEKYMGELLKIYGYDSKTNLLLEGKCVTHEVDVLAVNQKEVILVECKYRNRANSAPDVKVAMYVHSRFQDLNTTLSSSYEGKTVRDWLVTNTRFTEEAIRYADCAGFHVKSWRHPKNDSLEKIIEDKKLYPVTVLSSLNTSQIKKLIEHHIILMRTLAKVDLKRVQSMLSLSEKRARGLLKEANDLCFCD